jgi:transcriptional regulator with XRE-family HTH domain
MDQETLARLANVSVATIERMEAREANVRGIVDSLVKVVEALDLAGIELIGDNAESMSGGRGVRLKSPTVIRV